MFAENRSREVLFVENPGSRKLNVRDARKISAPVPEDLPRRAAAAGRSGNSRVTVARVLGLPRPAANRWQHAYQASGEESIRPRKRGRRIGSHHVPSGQDPSPDHHRAHREAASPAE